MGFNLDDYEPVADRITKFWADHPHGRITTRVLSDVSSDTRWVVAAELYRDDAIDGPPFATGLAEETVGKGNVNRDAALENCETSAIGRALANGGYATSKQRASREEMAKVGTSEWDGLYAALSDEDRKTVDDTLAGRAFAHLNGKSQDQWLTWARGKASA